MLMFFCDLLVFPLRQVNLNQAFLFSVGEGSNVRVAERVGVPLFNALVDFNSEKFDSVVDCLLPVKYEITDGLLSGSRAQVAISFLQFCCVTAAV